MLKNRNGLPKMEERGNRKKAVGERLQRRNRQVGISRA